jgi:pyochelin biosynthetic protein PchC
LTAPPLNNTWIRRYQSGPDDAPTVVCFPHAGGSASYFSSLSSLLRSRAQVFSLQYPGRQDRRTEPLLTTIDAYTDAVFEVLAPLMSRPLSFFGHSMGAMIAFEVATRMKESGKPDPAALFVSGRRAPSRLRVEESVHKFDDAGLIAELKDLSGTDMRVLDDPEVLAMVLPPMRSDYRAVENFRYRPGPKLDCPVVALIGDEDPKATPDECDSWRDHTSGPFELHVLAGGHFYLGQAQQAVADIISRRLAQPVA